MLPVTFNQVQKYTRGFEIYLAEICARVRYNQILTEQKTNRISSKSFLMWLDDRQTTKRIREGLISLYKKKHPYHFADGVWQPHFLFTAMDFIKKETQNKKFITSKKIRGLFEESFSDSKWEEMATKLFGSKMLEKLYLQNKLQTDMAKTIVRANLEYREMQNSFAKTLGKSITGFKVFLKEEDFSPERLEIAEAIFDKKIAKIQNTVKDSAQVIFGNVLALLNDHENNNDYQEYLMVKTMAKKRLNTKLNLRQLSLQLVEQQDFVLQGEVINDVSITQTV